MSPTYFDLISDILGDHFPPALTCKTGHQDPPAHQRRTQTCSPSPQTSATLASARPGTSGAGSRRASQRFCTATHTKYPSTVSPTTPPASRLAGLPCLKRITCWLSNRITSGSWSYMNIYLKVCTLTFGSFSCPFIPALSLPFRSLFQFAMRSSRPDPSNDTDLYKR
ncbi:hypothetical protein C8R44DRAFT_881978 [Mycena epipterygia]|nr:hypothetical protein C8R44DRAFT_881978 [Mycena epipterygia]